jgi:hypothetical protein
MPTYEGLLDEPGAIELASWNQGGRRRRPERAMTPRRHALSLCRWILPGA